MEDRVYLPALPPHDAERSGRHGLKDVLYGAGTLQDYARAAVRADRVDRRSKDAADARIAAVLRANVKLAGALDMVRETLNGGNVDDLLYIINTALYEHHTVTGSK